LIVVVFVIGALLAIALPVLSRARSRAELAVDLSKIRSHAQILMTYTTDHRDALPRPIPVGDPYTRYPLPNGADLPVRYFDTFQYWHIALASRYYNSTITDPVFHPVAADGTRYGPFGVETAFAYPCVFIAAPEFWNQYTRTGNGQFTPTRLDQVQFPSAKSLVVQIWPYSERQSAEIAEIPVATTDGSAFNPDLSEVINGYPRGDGVQFMGVGAVHFGDYPPFMHTVDGVRGRDFNR
jgi:type II secretory pathway pseudopilin PulG